jgi:hypothetical protein
MSKQRSINRELFAALLSAFIVVVSAVDMLGEKARLVNIIAIVAGGIGGGIALGRIAERLRSGTKSTPE